MFCKQIQTFVSQLTIQVFPRSSPSFSSDTNGPLISNISDYLLREGGISKDPLCKLSIVAQLFDESLVFTRERKNVSLVFIIVPDNIVCQTSCTEEDLD